MTPEERLLRLIRRHPHHPPSEASPPAEQAAAADSGVLAPTAQKILEPKGATRSRMPRLKLLQRVLLIVVGLNLFFLTAEGFLHRSRMRQIDELLAEVPPLLVSAAPSRGEAPLGEGAPGEGPGVEPYESIAPTFQGRELFRVLVAPPGSKEKLPAAGEQKAAVQKRLKELNLLGVVAGPTVQAIIDDAASKKTYFVREGESAADFRVVQILKGKVILELEGEPHELTL